jgi:hypothetical protein
VKDASQLSHVKYSKLKTWFINVLFGLETSFPQLGHLAIETALVLIMRDSVW